MATWRDGPRYAPHDRPSAFAQPPTGVSLAAPPRQAPAPTVPIDPPGGYQAVSGVALDQVGTVTATPRDPRVAYDVRGSALTLVAGPTGARNPREPYTIVAAAPAFVAVPAPDDVPPPPPVLPVSIRDVFVAAYPALLICLALGALVPYFSIPVLAIATVWLVPRVSLRVRTLRRVFTVMLGVVAACWVVFTLISQGTSNLDLNLFTVAQILNGCGLLADLALQWLALRAGERPQAER